VPAAVSKNAHSTFEWTAHKNAKVDGGNRKRHGAINETINGTSSLGTRSGGTRIIPVSKWLIVMVHKSPLRIGLWDPFQTALSWLIYGG